VQKVPAVGRHEYIKLSRLKITLSQGAILREVNQHPHGDYPHGRDGGVITVYRVLELTLAKRIIKIPARLQPIRFIYRSEITQSHEARDRNNGDHNNNEDNFLVFIHFDLLRGPFPDFRGICENKPNEPTYVINFLLADCRPCGKLKYF
jgi:hypothetical protein